MPAPAVSLSIPAVIDVAMHHQTHAVIRLPIRDAGTATLHITVTARALPGAATLHPLPAGARVVISPEHFTIQPGHTRQVKVRVTGLSGKLSADNIVFTASPVGHASGNHLAAAAATKVSFSQAGQTTATAPFHPLPQSSASSLPLDIGGGAAVLLVASGLALVVRHRRKLRAAAPATGHRRPKRHQAPA